MFFSKFMCLDGLHRKDTYHYLNFIDTLKPEILILNTLLKVSLPYPIKPIIFYLEVILS